MYLRINRVKCVRNSSYAQVMGELQLVELFEEGQRRIKRDIVFAASLYL